MNYEQQKKEIFKKKANFGCWVLEAINILEECSAADAMRDVEILYSLVSKRLEMEAKK